MRQSNGATIIGLSKVSLNLYGLENSTAWNSVCVCSFVRSVRHGFAFNGNGYLVCCCSFCSSSLGAMQHRNNARTVIHVIVSLWNQIYAGNLYMYIHRFGDAGDDHQDTNWCMFACDNHKLNKQKMGGEKNVQMPLFFLFIIQPLLLSQCMSTDLFTIAHCSFAIVTSIHIKAFTKTLHEIMHDYPSQFAPHRNSNMAKEWLLWQVLFYRHIKFDIIWFDVKLRCVI